MTFHNRIHEHRWVNPSETPRGKVFGCAVQPCGATKTAFAVKVNSRHESRLNIGRKMSGKYGGGI